MERIRTPRDIALLSALGALLIIPVLMLGSVHPLTIAITTALAVATGLVSLLHRGSVRARMDVIGLLLLFLCLITTLQLLPLPAVLVEMLSPTAWELRVSAARITAQPPPRWMPLTLDTTFTIQECARQWACLVAYMAAAQATAQFGARTVLRLILVSGVAAAFVFIAHRAFLLDAAYGIYMPRHLTPPRGALSTPLLNTNHMGGFLVLTTSVAIGLAVATAQRSQRWVLIGISALMGGSLLLTLSRGAIVAFVVAQTIFVVLMVFRQHHSTGTPVPRFRRASLPILGLVLSLGLGMFMAQDAIVGEFLNGDLKKTEIVREALPLMSKFPLTGTGRGTFSVAFPMVSPWAVKATFTHAENAAVQLVVDLGIPAALLFIFGIVFSIGAALLGHTAKPWKLAALSGVIAIGIHNLVDFNLEIMGVAIVASAALATMSDAKTVNDSSRPFVARLRRLFFFRSRPILAVAGMLLFLLTWLCGVWLPSKTLYAEEEQMRTALRQGHDDHFSTRHMAAVVERHPASWIIPFLKGIHTFSRSRQEALKWFGQTLRIHPYAPAAHYHVARILLTRKALSQALIECTLAVRYDSRYTPHCARILVDTVPSFEALQGLGGDDAERALHYDAIAARFQAVGNAEAAEKADQAALETGHPKETSFVRQIRRLSERGENAAAFQLLERMRQNGYDGPGSITLAADISLKSGLTGQARRILLEGLERHADDPVIIRHLAQVYVHEQKYDIAIITIRRLRSLASNEYQAALAVELEGDVERAAGNMHAALTRYRQASAMQPQHRRFLLRVLQAATENKDNPLILETLERLMHLLPGEPVWAERLEAQKRRMQPAQME